MLFTCKQIILRVFCFSSIFLLTMIGISYAELLYGGMDSGKSVFVTTSVTNEGSSEMNVTTKVGSYSSGDIEGVWYRNAIESSVAWWSRCVINAQAGSGASRNVEVSCLNNDGETEEASGVITLNSSGEITININPSFHCHLDSGKTIAACTETEYDESLNPEGAIFSVLTKKGSSYSVNDIAGQWYINAIESPGPYWEKGLLTLNSNGTFSLSTLNSESETDSLSGSWSLESSTATVTITPQGMSGFPCKVDAGQTFMSCVFSSGDSYASFVVMTKKAQTYDLNDLNAIWQAHSFQTGPSAPWWSRGTVTPTGSADGAFTVSGQTYSGSPFSASGFIEISTDTGVTTDVTSCSYKPVKINSDYFNTIWGAYNNASASGQIIKARSDNYYEALNFSGDYAVILQGGYNCDHTSRSGYSTIHGNLTLSGSSAAVALDGIIIR